jgi:hypothetical protein
MHKHSLKAYDEEKPALATKAGRIYALLLSGGPKTVHQIMLAFNTANRNAVAPRVTDLCNEGWVEEAGKAKCHYTGKTVALYRALAAETRRARREASTGGQMELFATGELCAKKGHCHA